MIIRTTPFGEIIVTEAEKLLLSRCVEKSGKNDGECIKALVQEYNLNTSQKKSPGMAYCAMTQSVILDRAFAAIGLANEMKTASAADWLNIARKNNLLIDKNAASGAIFLTKSSTGSGYHAGLVWYIDEARGVIGTIEGNTTGYLINDDGCLTKASREGIVTKERSIGKVAHFIHTEKFFDEDITVERELYHSALAGLGDDYDICYIDDIVDDSLDEAAEDNTDEIGKWIMLGGGLILLWSFIKYIGMDKE